MRGVHDLGQDPDYRATLANERTFLAWIRTSLALLAGAVAVVQFVPTFGFPGAPEALGGLMAMLAFTIAATAHRRWMALERAMRLGESLPPSRLLALIGLLLAATAGVVFGLILFG